MPKGGGCAAVHMTKPPATEPSLLSEEDLYLFNEGTHNRIQDKLGSHPMTEDGGRVLTYREMAPRIAEYVAKLGFTHVEFLPLMEHPFYGCWGYQTTGFFA